MTKKLIALLAPTFLTMLTAFSLPTSAAQDFSDIEIKTVQVTDKIYMLMGAGGNIGVSKGLDGLLMIDDQFRPLAPKIKTALLKLGDDSPTWLLNTHYHGDHTGGNIEFGKDSTIVAHANVRTRLVNGDTQGDFDAPALPVVTYEKKVTLYFNDEAVELMYAPNGHTDGDTIVYFTDSNVVHMGDHFFKDRFPYVDMEHGGTVEGYKANLKMVLEMIDDDTRLIPGHGTLANKEDLVRFLNMIEATSATVKAAIESGANETAVLTAGLDDMYESWGSGFINEERWLKTLYNTYK